MWGIAKLTVAYQSLELLERSVRSRPIAVVEVVRNVPAMDEDLHPYLITAYTEWETLEIEAACRDDQHAIDKARRYGSLRHVGTNFPAVIFSHVVALEPCQTREVGTWEYRLNGEGKPGHVWHAGEWSSRPTPDKKQAIRHWVVRA